MTNLQSPHIVTNTASTVSGIVKMDSAPVGAPKVAVFSTIRCRKVGFKMGRIVGRPGLEFKLTL